MLRVFSGSCMSLEDLDTFRGPKIIQRPHVLGPGTDFFNEDGEPIRPQPGAHTLQKVFSGSALDLNAMNGDIFSEDEGGLPGSPVAVRDTCDVISGGTSAAAASTGSNGANLLSPVAARYRHPASPTAEVTAILTNLTNESEKERLKAAKNKTIVLVVGGSGYIACHVVAKLLDAGYTVRVTVPEALSQAQQIELYSMAPEAAHRLSVTEADITNAGSLKEVIRGCRYVVHCGVSLQSGDGTRDVVKMHMDAVQALFDAIRISGKPTVKRVIMTGAASSICHITDPLPPSKAFDESHWNLQATASREAVTYAKVCFEQEAWRLKAMIGVELTVVLPSIVIGPSRTGDVSEAMITLQELASASRFFPFAPNIYWNFVDVRDVADAHVRAMEHPECKDRRIIASNVCISLSDLSKLIKAAYPHLTPPTRTASTFLTLLIGATLSGVKLSFLWHSLGVKKQLDNTRIKTDLDFTFTPVEVTVKDSVEQWIHAGVISTPPSAEGTELKGSWGKRGKEYSRFGPAAIGGFVVAGAVLVGSFLQARRLLR